MNNKRIIVDRIENGFAVCENGIDSINVPLPHIDGDVREGDVLLSIADSGRYIIDREETENRRADISARFNRLKKRR